MAGPRDIRAGGGFVELGVKDFLDKHLKRAGAKLRAFGSTVAGIGAAVSAAGTAALAPFGAAVTHFAAAGDAIDKAAARTGASAELLSELGFAAEQSGTSAQDLELGLKNLARSTFDLQLGLSTATDAFAEMGLAASDLEGQSPDEMLYTVAQALSEVEDASTKAALAQRVFGRSGTKLLPLLSQGAAGLEALRQEARDLGLTIGPEQAKAAAAVTDAYNRVKRSIAATVFQIGSALAPAVLTALDSIKQIAVAAGQWISENKQLVVIVAGVAAAVVAAGVAITGLGLTIAAAGVAFSGLAALIGAVLSPLGLLVGAAAAAGAALVRTGAAQPILDSLATKFQTISDRVKEVGGAVVKAFKSGDFELLGEILKTGLAVAFTAAKNRILEIWGEIVAQMKDVWFGLVEEIAVAIARSAAAIDELRKKPGETIKGVVDLSREGIARSFTPEGQAKIAAAGAEPSAGEKAEAAIREEFKRQREDRKAERSEDTTARERQLAEQTAALEAALAKAAALPEAPASPAVDAAVAASKAATAAVEQARQVPAALERGSREAAEKAAQLQRQAEDRRTALAARTLKTLDEINEKLDEAPKLIVEGGA